MDSDRIVGSLDITIFRVIYLGVRRVCRTDRNVLLLGVPAQLVQQCYGKGRASVEGEGHVYWDWSQAIGSASA